MLRKLRINLKKNLKLLNGTQRDELLLALSNDKWRPQDRACDVQLAMPFLPFFPPLAARFFSLHLRSVEPLPTSGAPGNGLSCEPCGGKAARASAFCWHLINKIQTIVPVGFTHRLLSRSVPLCLIFVRFRPFAPLPLRQLRFSSILSISRGLSFNLAEFDFDWNWNPSAWIF